MIILQRGKNKIEVCSFSLNYFILGMLSTIEFASCDISFLVIWKYPNSEILEGKAYGIFSEMSIVAYFQSEQIESHKIIIFLTLWNWFINGLFKSTGYQKLLLRWIFVFFKNALPLCWKAYSLTGKWYLNIKLLKEYLCQ